MNIRSLRRRRGVPARLIALLLVGGCAGREGDPVGPSPSRPVAGDMPVRVPVSEIGRRFELVGQTGEPLFSFVRVEAEIMAGPYKGYESGPNLKVRRINGRATQAFIRIPLEGRFADAPPDKPVEEYEIDERLPFERGNTYALEGYEAGTFAGTPLQAYADAGVKDIGQTRDLYFRTEFVPFRAKAVEPIVDAPADFVGRDALIEGTAVSRDGRRFIDGAGWRLLVAGSDGPWPDWMEGKRAEAPGTVRPGPDARTFVVEAGARTRLVRLEDQLGRPVELRGRSWSMNNHWWFVYRGRELYVDGMGTRADWLKDGHARPVVVRGTLAREPRPDRRQITLVAHPPLRDYFVVRDATWEPLDALLAPEEVGDVDE